MAQGHERGDECARSARVSRACGPGHRRPLGHRRPGSEPRVIPGRRVQQVAERLDRVPHVREARVQGREPEAQDARLPVVADDPAVDQRLHDGEAVRMLDAHLAAAACVLTRCDQRQRVMGAARLDELDEQVRQRERLRPQGCHVGLGEDVEAALHERQ